MCALLSSSGSGSTLNSKDPQIILLLLQDSLCVSKKDIECSQKIFQPKSSSCLRWHIHVILLFLFFKSLYFARACSGLVVSGYSKHQKEESLVPAAALYQYKKFKKMPTIFSKFDEFKGTSKAFISLYYVMLIKIITLNHS